MSQINHVTKKEYTGENETALEVIKATMGFTSDEWLTFIQAKNAGFKVIKGSKGVGLKRVVKYNKLKKGKVVEETGIKGFRVFNLNQVEKA